MHMVRHIADWVIVMAEGKIIAEGAPDEVTTNVAVVDAYWAATRTPTWSVVTGRIQLPKERPNGRA